MQRLTTKEPDEAMIEVAIEALNCSLTGEAPEKEEAEETIVPTEIEDTEESK